ncbi:ap-4 complex subunit epsilon-1 [Anaeramoeba flamelloides]|uniref:AP-2 complex subunit alpha n=1 Tax=Anaeramoeba flamelloides TaxID=1746091 RepID=A0ABQ8XWC5_9EUKA|nr:ap-4 complex subunit epsilon-1 [Anaeramoeba flamelloides]
MSQTYINKLNYQDFVNPNKPNYITKEFEKLIREIGDCKSKLDEDRLIEQQIIKLKKFTKKKKIKPKQQSELVLRLLFCQLLGHDVSFAHILAINSSQESNLFYKFIGYLAASIFISTNEDLQLLMINSIQKDLKSDNTLAVSIALTTITKIITVDMIPAVLSNVLILLKHQEPLIRKKALTAMYTFLKQSPESILKHQKDFELMLDDKDISVTGVALDLFLFISKTKPKTIKHLVVSFVEILNLIISGKLPIEYDYREIHAPWIQIKLLKILSYLGQDDPNTSREIYQVVQLVLKESEIGFINGIFAGHAIMHECIKTITKLYPSTKLLELASIAAGKFVTSYSNNLKYLGITALTDLVLVYPEATNKHQIIIVDCLEDPDETLKRKTIELLFRITNKSNISFIVEKMLSYLKTQKDQKYKTSLVSRILKLAEEHGTNIKWYILTINKILQIFGDLVNHDIVYNIMKLISEGSLLEDEEDEEDEDDEEEKESGKEGSQLTKYDGNTALKIFSVNIYAEIISLKKPYPNILYQISLWVAGEYSYLCTNFTTEEIMVNVVDLINAFYISDETRAMAITALTKMVSHSGKYLEQIDTIIQKYSTSRNTDIRQRCFEMKGILQLPNIIDNILPPDSINTDIEIDTNLEFLNEFVENSLKNGGKKYISKEERIKMENELQLGINENKKKSKELRFEAYQSNNPQQSSTWRIPQQNIYEREVNNNQISNTIEIENSISLKVSGISQRWTETGYSGFKENENQNIENKKEKGEEKNTNDNNQNNQNNNNNNNNNNQNDNNDNNNNQINQNNNEKILDVKSFRFNRIGSKEPILEEENKIQEKNLNNDNNNNITTIKQKPPKTEEELKREKTVNALFNGVGSVRTSRKKSKSQKVNLNSKHITKNTIEKNNEKVENLIDLGSEKN